MKRTLGFSIFLARLICLQFAIVDMKDIEINLPGEYALPSNVKPEIYDLNLVTDLYATKFSYKGDVTITVRCSEPTKEIVLFAKIMTIYMNKITVKSVTSDGIKMDVKIANRQHQILNDLLVIVMEDELVVDKTYEIFIKFENKPVKSEVTRGYYSIMYGLPVNGNIWKREKKLAVTYFDSVYASRAFPCFDQMNLKAKFKFTHIHEKSSKGFSSMKLLTSEPIDGSEHEVKDIYEESERISPFVMAIALAGFTSRRKETLPENKKLEIWADDIASIDLKFLGDMAVHAFKFYSKHFGVAYALSKLDILMIPYYQPWNEEKYGLIVMNETFLLSPENSSNDEMKFNIALDVCQAIGQQWIGTYTTMSWWNEYWFQEALLLFNGALCVDKAFDGWEELFFRKPTINSFNNTLKFDAEITSVPIMQSSTNKFDSVEKFIDKKLMEKAHQLFRTMHYFLGEEEFKRCVTNYIKEYKFGNSSLDDVWKNFTTTANAAKILPQNTSMKNIMDPFIYRSGYPLINVRINTERTIVTLTQKRFIYSDENEQSDVENDCWIFPVSFITKNRLKRRSVKEPVRDWLICDNSAKTINMRFEGGEWILLDYPLGVLCRVQYDESNWKSLGKTLLHDKDYKNIDDGYRIRLILDMFELSKIGKLDYQIVFEIMMYVRHEMYYFAWNEAMERFIEFRLYLLGTTALKPYEMYVRKILKAVFTKKEFQKIDDFPDKSHLQLSFKASVVWYSCVFNVEDCRDQCQKIYGKQFPNIVTDHSDIGPLRGIRQTVLCEHIRHDKTDWNFLFQLLSSKKDDNLYTDILEALSCSTEETTLRKYLNWSIDYKITPKESVIVFRSMSYNAIGYTQMKEFFLEEFDYIYRFFDEDIPSFQDYIGILFRATMNEEDLIQLNELVDSRIEELKELGTVIRECQAQAARNVQWLKQNKQMLSDLFMHLLQTENLLQ